MTRRAIALLMLMTLTACGKDELPNDAGAAEKEMRAEAQTLEEAAAKAAEIVEQDAAAEAAAAMPAPEADATATTPEAGKE